MRRRGRFDPSNLHGNRRQAGFSDVLRSQRWHAVIAAEWQILGIPPGGGGGGGGRVPPSLLWKKA